ncbi:quinol:cytochrome C oxidoreductase [Chitinophagaceae bacterium LB-8]|uniref:Quinol:cytochrome C oxidoreductase n=1 Tax=Paraflavisolibacter caeni TaxID=2982496 RepID=A0A9X3B9G5_9BACT|nr:quinol:cytochrome C oxidoreductase [Paraflavisolibacter caeni]MCU7551241.1 quinol:cytochrome C oxidoreductase [Paraflavisolibacter caeni]
MALREQYLIPKKYNNLSLAFMAVGLLSIIVLFFTHGTSSDPHEQTRFWASLLQNSVYFLLVVNASMFFICATTLAWGGWQMSFRRVTEAISACVPVIGVITLVILLAIVFGGNHEIYHWTDAEHVKHDAALTFKKGFLNKGFYTAWSIITVVGWWLLGKKMRQLSTSIDNDPLTIEEGKSYIWKNTVWAALYIILFSLTVMSSIPWFWLMSIDAHWFSTMYSWYTFASSFVAGIALITIYVVFLKNNGYLELVTREHLHDLGKFQFAFSIFWTYLWYSQFMLIWYANIPEETTYFEPRFQGVYRGIFFLNLIINFLAPLLILMKRASKRNYGTITMMSVLILFGHWLDFYQMVFPSVSKEHVPFMLADLGIALGFVGLIMFLTARHLAKHPLFARNHPFLKESIIHHT